MFGTQEIVIIVIPLLIIAIIVFLFRGRRRPQQQQHQQSVVIQNESQGKKLRVCSKCGLQNEMEAKFCNECGFKFSQ